MATELEAQQVTASTDSKQQNEKDVPRKDKKRKRNGAREGVESPSPKKRRRAKDQPKAQAAKDSASTPLDSLQESPFYEETYSLFLPLSPISYLHPVQGLCAEHLSPLILTYYPPFNGVILSYSNTRLSSEPTKDSSADGPGPILAKSVDEYAVSFVWITVDFLIFRPRRHSLMEGWINLQNEGNVGLLCWNFFNVSIERRRLPKAWTWVPGNVPFRETRNHRSDEVDIESSHEGGKEVQFNGDGAGEGHFVDEHGNKVEGLIRFRVTEVETSRSADRENGFLGLEGTMLDEREEKELRDQKIWRSKERSAKLWRPRSEHGNVMSGALVNGNVGPMTDAHELANP